MLKEKLKKLIDHHNKKYWIENNPEISDEEFDKAGKDYINLGGSLSDFSFEHLFIMFKICPLLSMFYPYRSFSH